MDARINPSVLSSFTASTTCCVSAKGSFFKNEGWPVGTKLLVRGGRNSIDADFSEGVSTELSLSELESIVEVIVDRLGEGRSTRQGLPE